MRVGGERTEIGDCHTGFVRGASWVIGLSVRMGSVISVLASSKGAHQSALYMLAH